MFSKLLFPREFAPNPFYRSHSLAHQVPIATVRDNLYVLTDYSFAAVFRVDGMLYDLAGAEETAGFVEGLRGVLNTLVPGVQIKVLHRITHNYRDWLDEHLETLDGEQVFARYVAFEQAQMFHRMMEQRRLLRSDNLIVLTYKPQDKWWEEMRTPKEVLDSILDLAESSPVVQKPLRRYQKLIRKFEDIIRPTVQQMNMAGLNPRRLNNDQLYELAWEVLNPSKSLRQPAPPIRLPDPRDPDAGIFSTAAARKAVKKHREFAIVAPLSERKQLALSDMEIKADHVVLDGKMYATVTMRMLPTHVYPSMALKLAAIPFEATVAIDCLMLQKQKELDKQWKMARSAKSQAEATILGGTPDPANREKAQEIENRYMQMAASHENPFRMRVTIVIAGANARELDQRVDAVISLLRDMDNAVGVRERYGVDTLIRASWPFGLITDTHSRKALTSEVASILPIFSRWEGSKRPVTLVLDAMNRLVRLDPFPQNVLNKNRTICGASGSGKSFATQLALVQPHAARANTEILIVESGGSFELTTRCFGGVNVRLGPKSDYRINAFDLPAGFDQMAPDQQEAELSYKYDFLTKLVLSMADLRDPNEIKLAENVIGTCIQRTYSSTRQPRLRDFYRHLGQYANPDDPEMVKVAKRLQSLIRNYVTTEDGEAGIYSQYFDCETNFDVEAPLITLDLIDIKNTPALLIPMTMVTLMGLIYNRIMSRDGKDRLVIVDEAWALIKERPDGSPSPAGQAIELFWREGRKMGASSTMISQNYSDMTNDSVGRAIVANSPNQLFLVHERIADNDRAFRSANFSKEKMNRVYDLKTKYGEYSEIMVKEGNNWGVVRLPSPGLRYWLATTSPEDLKILKRYKKTFGEGYGLDISLIVAILAKDYPYGAHGAHGQEMSESEALAYADRFRDRLTRFEAMIRARKEARERGEAPKPIPYNFR